MLDFFIQELSHLWTQDGGRTAQAVLTFIEENPFAAPAEMEIDEQVGWEAYNRERAAKTLLSAPVVSIGVRADSPFFLEGSISCHPAQNIIKLSVDDRYLALPHAHEKATNFTKQWRSALPRFCWSEANADREAGRFYAERDLPWLPECFGFHLGWYRVISPLGYASYFAAESLRNAPAHHVEELPNETFAIMAYPDPLAYDTPEAREYVDRVTRALNAQRKDQA